MKRGSYYRHKPTGRLYRHHSTIKNGIILSLANENTGDLISNSEEQIFVHEINENDLLFEPFEFKLNASDKIKQVIRSYLPDIVYQLENYGIEEEMIRQFTDFQSQSDRPVYSEMVATEEDLNVEDFCSDEDMRFEFVDTDAETIFAFLHKGLVPILKKMLIEVQQ